ncbi:uncharacterized protein LOC133409943 isoform X2 [Phycodurus eques]|uniref:uncharacterized protein LOC133409943 isoform X2 n=1 Tax=Phycodurus eques TaxID=693459 RepID=UPI002ACE2173|nr:uncharacterized protein LOC133409943 isoform X2 [Phycodurus eques]
MSTAPRVQQQRTSVTDVQNVSFPDEKIGAACSKKAPAEVSDPSRGATGPARTVPFTTLCRRIKVCWRTSAATRRASPRSEGAGPVRRPRPRTRTQTCPSEGHIKKEGACVWFGFLWFLSFDGEAPPTKPSVPDAAGAEQDADATPHERGLSKTTTTTMLTLPMTTMRKQTLRQVCLKSELALRDGRGGERTTSAQRSVFDSAFRCLFCVFCVFVQLCVQEAPRSHPRHVRSRPRLRSRWVCLAARVASSGKNTPSSQREAQRTADGRHLPAKTTTTTRLQGEPASRRGSALTGRTRRETRRTAGKIRRRRPTPATLQIYRQPEVGDQNNTSGGSQVCTRTRTRSNLCRNLRVCQSVDGAQRKQSTLAPPTMKDLHVRAGPHSAGGPDCQLSPISAQLCDGSCPWTNRNGLDEANGNEAGLLANQERGLAQSRSSGRLESCVPEEEEEEEDIKHQNE